MKPLAQLSIGLCVAAAALLGSPAYAQNIPAVHLINDASQDAKTVLNSGVPFTTDFRGSGDVVITELAGTVNSLYADNYGGSTPGNNPGYLTTFVGATANGTGSGTAGGFSLLETNYGAPYLSLQYDFAQPLTSADRILVADTDNAEQYQVQAYRLVNGAYQAVSLAGWVHESFSGQTGTTPNASWPIWDPTTGTLTSNTGGAGHLLNEPLDVLTPDQPVDRIVFTKLDGSDGSAAIQIIEVPAADVALPSSFFTGEAALGNGVYYLSFADGNYFGYYSYLSDPHYVYHFDLGYEYAFDARDGNNGVYLYDFKSEHFFYTSPVFPFPYLFDFSLNTVLYYYPDPGNPGHYNTNGYRFFYRFDTGAIFVQ